MEVSTSKPVRFATLLAAAGKPTIYLPLTDPKKDRQFMRAVEQQRVLSIKQEPVGRQTDFGTVGFLKEKFVTYLIFDKSLQRFANNRVVGIKYDFLNEADAAARRGTTKATKLGASRKLEKRSSLKRQELRVPVRNRSQTKRGA